MEKGMETAVIIVLVIIVILAIWFFVFRKKKCASNADCPKGEMCGHDGYCHKGS